MKILEGRMGQIVFWNDHIVIMRVHPNVDVDIESAKHSHALVASRMPGDYGLLVDHSTDFSLPPVELMGFLNGITQLRAIAVVCTRENTKHALEITRRLFHRDYQYFDNDDDALAWLESLLAKPAANP